MGAMMRSYFLRASAALAVLVLPVLGEAMPGPYSWKISNLPALGAQATVHDEWANGEPDPIDLGFDFHFYGQTFNQVRIGPYGYVTLGYRDPKDEEHIEPGSVLQGPSALNGSAQPGNLIAAWWGNHHCDPENAVKYQFLGSAPKDRHLRVEWHCFADSDKEVAFTAQLRIYENSSVVQLYYGSLQLPAEGGSIPDWTQVRAGIKNHNGSEYSNALACESCKRDDFPSLTAIQYGIWKDYPDWDPVDKGAELMVAIDPESVVAGVDRDVNGNETVWVALDALGRNLSELPTDGAVFHRVYLTTQTSGLGFGPGDIELLEGEPLDYEGWPAPGSTVEIASSATRLLPPAGVDVPSGRYFLCVQVAGAGTINQYPPIFENDVACHPEPLYFGPDLTGEITSFPEKTRVMEPFSVGLKIRNVGNRKAVISEETPLKFGFSLMTSASAVSLVATDARRVINIRELDTFIGELPISLEPGQEETLTVEVMVPFVSFDNEVEFPLRLDIDTTWQADGQWYDDADQTNNKIETESRLKLLLPNYSIESGEGRFDLEMPLDCVLGEPVWGQYEICNNGEADGYAFRPEVRYWIAEGGAGFRNEDVTGRAASLLPVCSTYEEDGFRRWWVYDDSLCDEGSVCALGACWQTCDPEDSLPNNGCAEGFKCMRNPYVLSREDGVENTCVPFLEQDQCHVYEFEGLIPTHIIELDYVNMDEPPFELFPDPVELMPIVGANVGAAPAGSDDSSWAVWNQDVDSILCQYPRPDVHAVSMPTVVTTVVAGNPFNVERRFRNIGTLPTDFEYGYYLSNVPEVSPLQLPVPVFGSPDGLGRSWVTRKVVNADRTTSDGVDQRTDTVVVPSRTPPGIYYFGVVVDPNEKIEELDKTNNTYIYPQLIEVVPPDLVIETNYLPMGTVGVRYNHALWVTGGVGGYRWEKGEGFPSWLDLDPQSGHLSGIPTEERDYVFTVHVRSGAIEARRTFALRVLQPEGRLSIPNHVLPVAVTGRLYGPVELKANGGLPPYTWTTTSLEGTGDGMPPNFCFENGVIRSGRCNGIHDGVPPITPGAYRFLATVTDSRNAKVTRELTIYVAGSTALTITTPSLPNHFVGSPYPDHVYLAASGGNMENYEWTVTGLPKGLVATPVDQGRLQITGIPEEFGAFMVNVTVSDEGMQASRMYTIEIYNTDLYLEKSHLGEFFQGDPVNVELVPLPNSDAQITILQGRLPSGLELTADKRIVGTISTNAEPGNYSLLLELRSERGSVSPAGLGITVLAKVEEEKKEEEPGCGSSATGSSTATGVGFAAVLFGLYSMRFRRRAAEAN